jgi:hypothetical protein
VPSRLGPSAAPKVWTRPEPFSACCTAVPSRNPHAASMPCTAISPAAMCWPRRGRRFVPTGGLPASTVSPSPMSKPPGWGSSSTRSPQRCGTGCIGPPRCGGCSSPRRGRRRATRRGPCRYPPSVTGWSWRRPRSSSNRCLRPIFSRPVSGSARSARPIWPVRPSGSRSTGGPTGCSTPI